MAAEITLIEAVRLALARAMEMDKTVLVFGEDVAVDGGVFRATDGLLARFGNDRVLDTPLSEGLIVGHAVGLSTQGFRPVAEIQFMGFSYPILDQLINHASRLRNRTRGKLSCPMVVRMPYGAGVHAPEHHSESTEALLTHIPGLRVVIPSSPAKAYGLLLAAIQNPDPVIFLEPTRMYRAFKEPVIDDGVALPLDKTFIIQEGDDLTLVTWGAMMTQTQEAAAILKGKGIHAEIIDVATLVPLDMTEILASVQKTGRCIIIHEAVRTSGFGAEIGASIAEKGLLSLLAPIERVTGFDVIVPMARLEHHYIPSVDRILEAAYRVLKYS